MTRLTMAGGDSGGLDVAPEREGYRASASPRAVHAPIPVPPGRMLSLWIAVVIGLQGILWLSGVKALALNAAVERGAARVESRAMGEASEDQIREAIRSQRDTLPFWTTLALIGDFVVEPLALAVRSVAVSVLLGSLAALSGRPVGFDLALSQCARAQGIWVLGLMVRVALVLALRSPDAETSMAVALPAGTYPALGWAALRQVDVFALWGWAALARDGWRRGQANLVTAAVACALLALGEAALRIGSTLVVGGGM